MKLVFVDEMIFGRAAVDLFGDKSDICLFKAIRFVEIAIKLRVDIDVPVIDPIRRREMRRITSDANDTRNVEQGVFGRKDVFNGAAVKNKIVAAV